MFHLYLDSDAYSACSTSVSSGVSEWWFCDADSSFCLSWCVWGSALGFLFLKILLLGRAPWGGGSSETAGSPGWNEDVLLNTKQLKCCSNEKAHTHTRSISVYVLAPCSCFIVVSPATCILDLKIEFCCSPLVGQADVSLLSVLAAGLKAPVCSATTGSERPGKAVTCLTSLLTAVAAALRFSFFPSSPVCFLCLFFFFLGSMLWSDSAHSRTKLVLVQLREQQELAEGVVAAHSSPCSERKTPLSPLQLCQVKCPHSLSLTGFLLLWIFLALLLHAFFPPIQHVVSTPPVLICHLISCLLATAALKEKRKEKKSV